jgi:hypothetical protein
LWAWTNPKCGLFEFATVEDFRTALTKGLLAPDALVWRNAPECQSIPARFLTVPWTLHRPGAAPEKLDFVVLQRRYLAGELAPGSRLGQDGKTEPERIFGRR